MITPTNLGLPYPDWRPFQFEAIMRTAELFNSGTENVIIEAPPGSGKTGIAAGVSRFLEVDGTLFLTATKDLQNQYVRDVDVEKLVGRANYRCLIDPRLSAAQGRCISLKCRYAGPKGMDGCPYYDDLRQALAAPEVVLNYPAFLYHANYAKNFHGRGLLVCDEAHMLRSELEGFVNATLSPSRLNRLGLMSNAVAGEAEDWDLPAWLEWVMDSFDVVEQEIEELKVYAESGPEGELGDAVRVRANDLKSTLQTLDTIMVASSNDNLILDRRPEGARFRPVWVAEFARKYLLHHSDRILFLTATPGDFQLFCQTVGIDPTKSALIRVPSTFDRNRRPIHYQPVIKVLGGPRTGESADALVPYIDRIIEQHGSQRGIVHTVSYPLAAAILQRSRHRGRLMSHLTENREQVLNTFRQSEDKVLLSPSMTTGVDLPYDQLRFQVLAKLPFADRSDLVLQAQSKTELGNKLGLQDCAITLAQAYGRGMRAEDDFCVTYLLDRNYDWFRWAAKAMIPSWFTEAIVRH
jgi:ATP-dependent DNA helicase DinG